MIPRITQWLLEEEQAFIARHDRAPIGREIEDVVDNVYPMLSREGIQLSYGSVYDHYRELHNKSTPGQKSLAMKQPAKV